MPVNAPPPPTAPEPRQVDPYPGAINTMTFNTADPERNLLGPRTLRAGCYLTAIIGGETKSFSGPRNKFDALAERWNRYTGGRSVTEFNHAAYWQIVGMGKAAIPFLLEDLDKNNGRWFKALKYITGIQMGDSETRGDFRALKRAWLEWGRLNGLRTQLLDSTRGGG
jgi:hypothetical protein